MSEPVPLLNGYSFQLVEKPIFQPFFDQHYSSIFKRGNRTAIQNMLSEAERAARNELKGARANLYQLHLLIYFQSTPVGWSYGEQVSEEDFLMRNTALLPEHQRKGVYSALLPKLLPVVAAAGFQVVRSRHVATNNNVLIPKLKAGFVITGTELNERWGVLVNLSYYFNKSRERLLREMSGELTPLVNR
jgi:hypothetical protein